MATYRQRGKKKLWDYRIYGKDRQLIAFGSGFRTKKEAMYEARAIEQQLAVRSVFKTNATLYEMWVEWHRLVIIPSKLSQSSKDKHIQRGKVIKEYFNSVPANKITHSEYQDFINDYCSRVLVDQVSRFNSVVKNVIAMSSRDGALISDFTDGVKIQGEKSRKSPEEKYIDSAEDYERILVYLKSIMDYEKSVIPYMLYTYFTTGYRPGEGAAICWEDIDFERLVLKTYRRYSGDKKKFYGPKTPWSVRETPISPEMARIFLKLRREQEKVLSERGVENTENLIFFNYLYGVPTCTAIVKYLRKVLRKLELPATMTTNGTRHTYGSYLLAKKVDIWVVAKVLGHKDIKQLIETYGHLMKEIEVENHDEIRRLVTFDEEKYKK
ncbi:TPA: site-specific integrase [Streptococcus suis]|nr:site-specific integrase [Streptococcus suis]HEL2095948.1 site-specific integrase [Streptococcus suis]